MAGERDRKEQKPVSFINPVEGQQSFLYEIYGEPVAMHHAEPLPFLLFYLHFATQCFILGFLPLPWTRWISTLFPSQSQKWKPPKCSYVFLGVICSCYLGRCGKWWAGISALPCVLEWAGGTCPLHLPSSRALRLKRATVASHRCILGEYLVLEGREYHKAVTCAAVRDGSLVEGCWNSDQLRRGKSLKAP